MERVITYGEAIREALIQEMERDPNVLVLGQGVDDFKGVYGTTLGLQERFGPDRVFDTPLSEDGMVGAAIGMAIAGLRPVHVHIRVDFLLLAMNQLINIAAKARYMFGGAVSVPLVVRAIIGRSWGQGPQHSQALHAFFAHVPGLRVVAPTTPYDAKGMLIRAIREDDPVLFFEHRMLHRRRSPVPEEPYALPLGRARVLRAGRDVTLVGVSHMVIEALRAAEHLERVGISAEVIDPVTLAPLDLETIAGSARKTGHLLVVDNAWTCCGLSAEVVAAVLERLQDEAVVRVGRMGFAPVVCPTTRCLEDLFYPNAQTIAATAHRLLRPKDPVWVPEGEPPPEVVEFKGPF